MSFTPPVALSTLCLAVVFGIIRPNLALSQSTPTPSISAARLSYHPGDVLTYTFRIEGPGADKLNLASITLSTPDPEKPGQQQFLRSFGTQGPVGKPADSKTFTVRFPVPPFAADGDYKVTLDLRTSNFGGGPSFHYDSNELPFETVHVKNDEAISKPKIVKEPSI